MAHCQVLGQAVELRTKAEIAQRFRPVLADVESVYEAFAASGLNLAREYFEGGRFAGSIEAQKTLIQCCCCCLWMK